MAEAVQRDLVPLVDDPPRDVRVLPHLLTHEEERRLRAAGPELVENGRRAAGVRPVVERQGDPVEAREAALDAVVVGEPLRVRRECRAEPAERRSAQSPDTLASASTSDAADGSAASVSPGVRRRPSASPSASTSSGRERATSAIP